jgi:hypothetical protein
MRAGRQTDIAKLTGPFFWLKYECVKHAELFVSRDVKQAKLAIALDRAAPI